MAKSVHALKPAATKSGFKVIIAGGSVAGLTLAHAFSAAGVDYELLEARDDIAPQVGASIVLLPNGLRVMDQLGCYEDLEEAMEPLKTAYAWTEDGGYVGRTDGPELAQTRMGYPCAFLARQRVLQILYDRLDETDKAKIKLGKRVDTINQSRDGVVVKCADGSEVRGDIVLGADGVHSKVRYEMRRHADEAGHAEMMKKDRKSMYAEYSCVFGISLGVTGIEPGIGHRAHGKDCSTLCFVGKNDRVFWFFIKKLDKRYYEGSIPRFARSDIDSHLQPHKNMKLTDKLTVGDCWEKVSSVSFVALEEACYDNWTYGRIACVGDSIHKMTPNMGQGGNSAIESATVLVNNIKKMLENNPKPEYDEVCMNLLNYQDRRRERTHAITNAANELTRMEAMATLPHKIFALHVAPLLGDFIADLTGDTVIGAERLEFLPPPPRSMSGHMPFDPKSGIGHKENKFLRMAWCLPFIFAGYYAASTYGASVSALKPLLQNASDSLFVPAGLLRSIPLVDKFTGYAPVDNYVRPIVASVTPYIANVDPVARAQFIAFLADLVPLQAIWTIETIRRSNFLTVVSIFPFLFTLGLQFKGFATVAPWFYFFHWVQAPMENLQAIDNRLCNMNYVKTILPSLILGYLVPSVLMMSNFLSLEQRQLAAGVWSFFPIITAVLHVIFATLFVTDTTQWDRMNKPENDLPYLRSIYITSALISSAAYLYTWVAAPVGLKDVFFSGLVEPSSISTIVQGVGSVFRYDHILTMAMTALWVLYSFKDLKTGERLDASWLKIGGIIGGTSLLLGPGTGLIAAWAWREQLLTKKLEFKY